MSIFGCQRGTASVEIVVMLPVFILLFLGVMHIHSTGIARQEAQSAARACAYYYAVNGCSDDAAKAAICKDIEVGKIGEIEKDSKDSASIVDKVGQWPILGPLVTQLFGEGSRALAERQAQAFVGDDDSKVSGRFYMVCNTVSQSWSGKVPEILCGAGDLIGLGKAPGCP